MQKLRFHIDRIAHCKAYGWVMNEYARQQRLLISIVINGEIIASDHANVYRQDLHNAGLGDGTYGFEIYVGMLPQGRLAIFADQQLIYAADVNPRKFACLRTKNNFSSLYFSEKDLHQTEFFLSKRRNSALFIFAVTTFYPRIQRHQQFAYAFAQQGIDVFFVEPLFRAGTACRLQRLTTHENIYILNLPTCGRRADFITGNVDPDLAECWKNLLNPLTQFYSSTFCIWSAPQWLALMSQPLTFSHSIFDVIDDYCATFSQPNLASLLKWALHLVDGISYTSMHLPNMPKQRDKKSIQIRNGFAEQWLISQKSVSSTMTLGYVGALDAINGKWLLKFLQANPIASLIMGSGSLTELLVNLANQSQHIYMTGEVTHPVAMTYLQYCRFGAIFFRSQAIARWVNPVKCYEYIALGIPIVASHLIDLEPELHACCRVITEPQNKFSNADQRDIERLFLRTHKTLELQQYGWQHRSQQMRTFLESF